MFFYYLYPFLIFGLLFVIQLTIVPFFAVGNITPDLITILVVYIAVNRGKLSGTVYGFLLGFLYDLFSGGLIGSAMFSKTLTGFIGGYFYNVSKEERASANFKFILIVFLCASIDSLFYSLFGTADIKANVLFLLIDYSIFPGMYTALISFPVLALKLKK